MGVALVVIGDIITFLPFVDNIITGLEGLFHKGGNGTQKKQIAMQTITATLTALGLVAPGTSAIAPSLEQAASALIDDIVKWKNLTGSFASSATASAVGPKS